MLSSKPTIASAPSRSNGRSDVAIPKATSSEPVLADSIAAQAVCTTTFVVTPVRRAYSDTRWANASSISTSRRERVPALDPFARSPATRVADSNPSR
ncbi:unannotated protein [freshwater metagenome]|uniref:Unannotated protein n=1 Tax=freshwater metagenome TaxID=449393 RepID=A0A6J7FWN3_9ZZZZ